MDDPKKCSATDSNNPPGPETVAKKAKLTNNTENNDRIGKIENEFRGVPNSPIWLHIATFLEEDERHRIFPNIPELKGIERLADAIVDSQKVMKYIKLHDDGETAFGYYFFHRYNVSKLFPEGFGQFLDDFHDRKKAVPPKKPELPSKREENDDKDKQIYDLQMEIYKIQMETYEYKLEHFKDMTSCDHNYQCFARHRLEAIMKGKDERLFYTKDPVTLLDVSVSTTKTCSNSDKNGKPVKEVNTTSAIAVPSELWVMFGFKGLHWYPGHVQFEEFCALAGIEDLSNNEIISFNGRRDGLCIRNWISTDKKVLICMQGGGKRFGCTAERSRGKFLYEWIQKNGSYYEWHPSYRCFV